MACDLELRITSWGDHTCLTAKQARKLFGPAWRDWNDWREGGDAARRVACGTTACVYDGPDRETVVKLTTDHGDAAALHQARGLPHVVQVQRTHVLRGGAQHLPTDRRRGPDLYALVVERLWPLPRRLHDVVNWISMYTIAHDSGETLTFSKTCDATCRQVAREVFSTLRALEQRGIRYRDLWEANVGVDARGVWKILDLGHTRPPTTALRREAHTLSGQRWLRRQKGVVRVG